MSSEMNNRNSILLIFVIFVGCQVTQKPVKFPDVKLDRKILEIEIEHALENDKNFEYTFLNGKDIDYLNALFISDSITSNHATPLKKIVSIKKGLVKIIPNGFAPNSERKVAEAPEGELRNIVKHLTYFYLKNGEFPGVSILSLEYLKMITYQ